MATIDRSPSLEHPKPSPCTIRFASTRRTHFPSFPFLSPSETNHHSHLLLLPEQALAAAVPSFIHRRAGAPPLPSLCLFVKKERRSKRKEELEEEEETYDKWAPYTPPWERYAFHGEVRVVSNPDVKPLVWSEPHYSLDLHSTPHTSFQALCDSNHSAATHGCRVTLFHPANLHKLPNSLAVVLLNCSID
uniref:Uncharacterized protein n=1 Tax=Oryza nivara TaxID=4536 RepID=A0A0E0GRI1_ORYNI